MHLHGAVYGYEDQLAALRGVKVVAVPDVADRADIIAYLRTLAKQ